MSQAEWMWVKIYNLSMHEPCAPTKWIKKPQITNLIHQILLIPTLRWDSLKKTSKKKNKREDGVLFNILVCYYKLTA